MLGQDPWIRGLLGESHIFWSHFSRVKTVTGWYNGWWWLEHWWNVWGNGGEWWLIMINNHWLVVWNMNFMNSHILGMSSSQLTQTYFSEGLFYHQPDEIFWSFMRIYPDCLELIIWFTLIVWSFDDMFLCKSIYRGKANNPDHLQDHRYKPSEIGWYASSLGSG